MWLHRAPTVAAFEKWWSGKVLLEYFEEYPTYESLLKMAKEEWWGDGDDYIFYLKNLTTGETLYEGTDSYDEDEDDEYDFDFNESLKSKQNIEKPNSITEDIEKESVSVKDALKQVIAKFGNHKHRYELTAETYERHGSGSDYTIRFYAPNDYIALLSMELHAAPTIENIEEHGYEGADILEYLNKYPTVDAFATYLDKNYMWDGDDFIVYIKNIDTGKRLITGSNDYDEYDYDEYDFDDYDFDNLEEAKHNDTLWSGTHKLKTIKESRQDIYNPDSEITFTVLNETEDVLVTYEGTETDELLEYVNTNDEAFYVVKRYPMEIDGFGYTQPEIHMVEETVFDRSCDDELTYDMLVEGE